MASLFVAGYDISGSDAGKSGNAGLKGPGDRDGYYVVLFRGSSFCPTCDVMERLTGELFASTDSEIAEDVSSGALFYKTINFELAGNEHYLMDYDLYTTTIVLIEQRSGSVKRWKNLQESWKESENEKGYIKYLSGEIKKFQEGGD